MYKNNKDDECRSFNKEKVGLQFGQHFKYRY